MKTLLIGTALVDHLIYSATPLLKNACNKLPNQLRSGGSLRNIAHNLAVLGTPPTFLAVWGNDLMAQALRQELSELKVELSGPIIPLPTPVFTALSTPDDTLLISGITEDFLIKKDYPFPYQDYELVVTDRNDPALWKQILTINNRMRFITIGFLADKDFQYALNGTIINRQEYEETFGCADYSAAVVNPASWLVVSLDQDGLFYRYQKDTAYQPNKQLVVQGYPIGCGDALAAGLLHYLNQDLPFPLALNRAQELAELCFQTPGNVLSREK